jgi:hypothetical protein
MLSNSTDFPSSNLRLANSIEQRGFPVVYMPHKGNNRGPRAELFRDPVGKKDGGCQGRVGDYLTVPLSGLAFLPLKVKAVLFAKFRCYIWFNSLIDSSEDI